MRLDWGERCALGTQSQPHPQPRRRAPMVDLRKSNPPNDQMTPGDANARPAPEVVLVKSKRVSCEGVGGALGHPKVYYDMGEDNFVECLYCDRRFALEPGAGGDHH
jgi:uncharacterized Zn-finger protein